jgi:hypothetical protein
MTRSTVRPNAARICSVIACANWALSVNVVSAMMINFSVESPSTEGDDLLSDSATSPHSMAWGG